ncbi:MAG: arginine--tRNA ligase [Pseudomonadota bacterium]
MKSEITQLLQLALRRLTDQGVLPARAIVSPQVTPSRQPEQGDFASNVALVHARAADMSPRALAEKLVAACQQPDWLTAIEIAGPGFINFRLAAQQHTVVIRDILDAGAQFGCTQQGGGERVHLEFVSANPTGPLHIGHGRGAAYGSVVARLLNAVGYVVHTEYYVNDAGRQMDILAVSVWLRYLQQLGESVPFPANGYQGDYVQDIATELRQVRAEQYRQPVASVLADLPPDQADGGDKELYIDALIARAKHLLGTIGYQAVFAIGRNRILEDIRDDLANFCVIYDQWYPEQRLFDQGKVQQALEQLESTEYCYREAGVCWFRSSALGDEKDRVLVRENGQPTYFASDVAYHLDRLAQGYTRLINIWGADHHGYVPRVKAAIQAADQSAEFLTVLLVQFASLYEEGEKQAMSTRSGEFITLRRLYEDVGVDAARFFYLMRRSDQHLAFDLTLARSQSNDNPVYYVQYAHARICAVLRQAAEKDIVVTTATVPLAVLTDSHEISLLKCLAHYPEMVAHAARDLAPHQVTQYLRDLARELHAYYNACPVLAVAAELRTARLQLLLGTRQVLRNGLDLLGVSAPERM